MASGQDSTVQNASFKDIAAVLSVVGTVGFVVSAIANQIVLLGWGVNFLAIATPADVTMLGLNLFVQIGFAILIPTLISAGAWTTSTEERKNTSDIRIATVEGNEVPDETPDRSEGKSNPLLDIFKISLKRVIQAWSKYNPDTRTLRLRIILIVYSLCFLIAFVFIVFSHNSLARDVGSWIVQFVIYGILAAFFVSMLSTEAKERSFVDAVRAYWAGELDLHVRRAVFFSALAGCILEIFFGLCLVHRDYISNRWYYGPGDSTCAPLNVLWVGQLSLLVRCPETGAISIVNRSSAGAVIRLEKIPREHLELLCTAGYAATATSCRSI